MERYLRLSFVIGTLAGTLAISLIFSGCGNNGGGDSQVVPYGPGAAYYNCIPGQPCNGSLVLTNNFGQPLRFSGRMTLDSSQSKSIINTIKSFQQQMTTGYGWNFCFGYGASTSFDRGAISMTASQVS